MTKHPNQARYQRTPKGKARQRKWKGSAAGRAWWANYRREHRAGAAASLRRHLEQQAPLRAALTAALNALNNVNDARAGIRPSLASARLAEELAGAAASLNSLITNARDRT